MITLNELSNTQGGTGPRPTSHDRGSPTAAEGGGWRGSVAACGRGGPEAPRREKPDEGAGQPAPFPGSRDRGPAMTRDPSETDDLLARARADDEAALADLFDRHRERLRRMVRLRLDRRLQGRVDPADVIQEAYLEVRRRLRRVPPRPVDALLPLAPPGDRPEADRPAPPPPRRPGRDAGREVSLHRGALPEATSAALAAQLLGRLTTPQPGRDPGRADDPPPGGPQRAWTRSTARSWPCGTSST